MNYYIDKNIDCRKLLRVKAIHQTITAYNKKAPNGRCVFVVPRVRIELTTPASSGLRSTNELPRHSGNSEKGDMPAIIVHGLPSVVASRL